MLPSTQQAIALTEIGIALQKITLPVPTPGENQILIKLTATGIAPLDQKLRDDGLWDIGSHLPAVLTLDLAGVVVSHGPGVPVSQFPVGQHVLSQGIMGDWRLGGLQEYTLVDSRYTCRVPGGIKDVDAVLYPVNAFTSFVGLFGGKGEGLGIPFPGMGKEDADYDYEKQTLLIIGGSSNCGRLAIMFARMIGIGKIIVTASKSKVESVNELRGYGATHVIDRHLPESEIRAQISSIMNPGEELVYIYDTMTHNSHSFAASLLSNTKPSVLAHLLPGSIDEKISQEKNAFEEVQVFGSSDAHQELARLFWDNFQEWVESGKVGVLGYKVIEGLDRENVNAAFDKYRDGRSGGERWHVKIS